MQISLKYGVFVIGIAFLEVGHSSKSQGHDIYKFYIFYQYASTVSYLHMEYSRNSF